MPPAPALCPPPLEPAAPPEPAASAPPAPPESAPEAPAPPLGLPPARLRSLDVPERPGGVFSFPTITNFLTEIGGFDDLYFPTYHDDVDLGWRAWKHGWRCTYQPTTS